MRGGAFIDDGEVPGAWADAISRPPWIADERDGTVFRHIGKQRLGNFTEADCPPVSHLLSHSLINTATEGDNHDAQS